MTRSTDRQLIARLGAHASWAKTPNRSARTAPGRQAFDNRFHTEVDPEGTLDPITRQKLAENARKAYFIRLARASAQARRKSAGSPTNDAVSPDVSAPRSARGGRR